MRSRAQIPKHRPRTCFGCFFLPQRILQRILHQRLQVVLLFRSDLRRHAAVLWPGACLRHGLCVHVVSLQQNC
jgi:hypothetical protein